MKKSDFVRIVLRVIEKVETDHPDEFTCNMFDKESSSVKNDYINVFQRNEGDGFIKVCFGFGGSMPSHIKKCKEARLNALSMYLAQSLEFKTYKDL